MGRWQLESGYTFSKAGSAEFHSIGELLFRVPLHQRVELRLFNVGLGRANAAGGGAEGLLDPIIGVKFRFQTGVAGKTPDLALIAQSSISAGSADFRVRRSQPSLRFAGYYQIDSVNGAGWEIAWSSLGPDGARFDQWAVSGYWSRTFNTRFAGFAEIYQLMPISNSGPSTAFADAGVTYLLDKAIQIDFRVGTGFNQRRDGWFMGAGIAFRF